MTVDRLVAEREGDWRALDALVRRADGRGGLPADEVLELGARYRRAAADLALLRRRRPHDPALVWLEDLVVRSRQAVYGARKRRLDPVAFFTRTYWVRVAERPRVLLLAAALLLVPALLAGAWALDDSGAALGLIPGEFAGAVEPVGDTGMTAQETAAFTGSVFTNNVQVAFLSFAAGIAFALGAAFVLAYNGAILGAVVGGATANGYGVDIIEFITAHGVIELSAIVVCAAAGMRMGLAIVTPGLRTRGQALAEEARAAVAIVLGTVPWIVLAGFIEGYLTRSGFGLWPGIVLGFAVGGAYWGLVVLRGARVPSP